VAHTGWYQLVVASCIEDRYVPEYITCGPTTPALNCGRGTVCCVGELCTPAELGRQVMGVKEFSGVAEGYRREGIGGVG
jgi:hypothetical protein